MKEKGWVLDSLQDPTNLLKVEFFCEFSRLIRISIEFRGKSRGAINFFLNFKEHGPEDSFGL